MPHLPHLYIPFYLLAAISSITFLHPLLRVPHFYYTFSFMKPYLAPHLCSLFYQAAISYTTPLNSLSRGRVCYHTSFNKQPILPSHPCILAPEACCSGRDCVSIMHVHDRSVDLLTVCPFVISECLWNFKQLFLLYYS